MSTKHRHFKEGIDFDDRDARALTDKMTVLPDHDEAAGAEDVYVVVSESGSQYVVDSRHDSCSCPDAEHRDIVCKHQRRVAFATGERAIPHWADEKRIDPQLGEHVEGGPVVTDGGMVDVQDTEQDTLLGQDRPDDCHCWRVDQELPCWPCYRDGFGTPNPATPAADDLQGEH